MDLSRLSEKQKRLQTWQAILKGGTLPAHLNTQLGRYVEQYASVLAECWESGSVREEQVARLQTLERELEDLDEFSRMRA